MGNTYGFTIVETLGRSIQLTADGKPEMKSGGVSIDWSTVAAVTADTTLLDGVTVKNGSKYLRYGQVVTLIGGAEVQTVTFTGGPTSGNVILTLPVGADPATQPAQTAGAVAFNASAAVMEAALNALSRLGPDGASVSRSGAGSNADPYVYTITFKRLAGDVPQLTSTNTFAGGTTPTATHATGTAGTGTGLYGPYDPAATDGRATLARGECYLLNETILEDELASNHPPVLEGGRVFAGRLIHAGTGTAALATGPTLANLLAAFPRLSLVKE